MEILIAIVMGVSFLFGILSVIAGTASYFSCYCEDDRREAVTMALVGVVLLVIGFCSAAYLGTKERARLKENAAYNRINCSVTVEGVQYHPDRVYVARGTGYMTMADNSAIQFLGGTIQNCR